jgi:hypothetical protein
VENPVDKVFITVEKRVHAVWTTTDIQIHFLFPQTSIVLHPFSTTYQQTFPQAEKLDYAFVIVITRGFSLDILLKPGIQSFLYLVNLRLQKGRFLQ